MPTSSALCSVVGIKLGSTTFGSSSRSPFNASGDSPAFSSRNGMRPSAVQMTCHASRFGGLSSIDYSRGRDGVCQEQGSISTGTKDSQMGSLECGRMEHSIVDCRCLAYWASYQRAWVALPCLAWLSLDIDRS